MFASGAGKDGSDDVGAVLDGIRRLGALLSQRSIEFLDIRSVKSA